MEEAGESEHGQEPIDVENLQTEEQRSMPEEVDCQDHSAVDEVDVDISELVRPPEYQDADKETGVDATVVTEPAEGYLVAGERTHAYPPVVTDDAQLRYAAHEDGNEKQID